MWSGDGRFDSMGRNAKYGVYSMFCSTTMKIVHFKLLQVNWSTGIYFIGINKSLRDS